MSSTTISPPRVVEDTSFTGRGQILSPVVKPNFSKRFLTLTVNFKTFCRSRTDDQKRKCLWSVYLWEFGV